MNEICSICGDPIKSCFSHKLSCNHTFHYECLQKSFRFVGNNCPYCRSTNHLLPLVNGLKKINYKIHDTTNVESYENIKCKTILKSGKNAGNECGNFCKLGYFTCTRHTPKII